MRWIAIIQQSRMRSILLILKLFPAICLCIFTLLSFACSAQKARVPFDTSASISVHIPTYKTGRHKGEPEYFYKCVRRDTEQMGLDSLEKGYDSLQIRIWLGHDMAVKKNLVVLKYSHAQWCGELWTFTYAYKSQTFEEYLATKSVKIVTPKSGWDMLSKHLLELQIVTLPDDDSLPGYNGCGEDGIPYYFEIATAKEYRFYKYCNIEDNIAKFKEARYVGKIADLLETEFSFQFTR
jgi:hypothetical protein